MKVPQSEPTKNEPDNLAKFDQSTFMNVTKRIQGLENHAPKVVLGLGARSNTSAPSADDLRWSQDELANMLGWPVMPQYDIDVIW